MPTLDRLVILGLDGATWTVLDPAIRRGWMPNLAALFESSARGTLRSSVPPVTSAAWTTFMTGVSPGKHGVFDHRHYDAQAGRMKVNHSGRVRVPTFWHMLSDSGLPVVSLNVPVTYPPLDVNGIVVSGMDAPHLDAALSKAPEFADRLKIEVPGYHMKVLWKRPPRDLEELRANSKATAEVFRARAEAAILADRMRPDWAALMVQFQNLDPFQHRAWRHLNVDETGIDDPRMTEAAGDALRGLDAAIGMLVELAERRGAAILTASDHGFGPCLGRIHVNRVLIDAGVARLPGPIGRVRRRVEQARDRLRLHRAKALDPEARSASFEASIGSLFPFDWKRTLAFAPHQDTAAMVYLNTSSRHADGPLKTPRQIDDAHNEVAAALASARHPETDRPLFPTIVSLAEEYKIDPSVEGYPDIIALPDEPYWVRTRLAPGRDFVEADPSLPGTHRPEGIVSLRAPGVSPGRFLKADLRDVAPTILSLFGLAIPSHVEGRPLPCLPAITPRRVDDGQNPWNGPHSQSPSGFEYTAEEQAVIEQRLADLGYLE